VKYGDYSIVLGDEDYPRDCYYRENHRGDALLRVHYRVTRLPSKKEITLRHLRDATPADRERAEAEWGKLRQSFAGWEHIGAVRRGKYAQNPRCAIFVAMCGTPVEDPLVQLELEMMIDQGKPEWLSEKETADVLGVTVSDLATMRNLRVGPAYYKPSLREVVYLRAEIDAFTAAGGVL